MVSLHLHLAQLLTFSSGDLKHSMAEDVFQDLYILVVDSNYDMMNCQW